MVEQGPELPEQVAGMSDDVALAELRGWIARSEAHKRVWGDFSRGSRKSQEHPVVVNQELSAIFRLVREALLVDEANKECEQSQWSEVGQKGQSWRVRESLHFGFVVVRVAPDLDSRTIANIMPREECIQRGAVMTMPNGIVRMPIRPEGWITYNSEEVGGAVFLDSVGGWTCHECTLYNSGEASTCLVCGTVRRLDGQAESSSHFGPCAPERRR